MINIPILKFMRAGRLFSEFNSRDVGRSEDGPRVVRKVRGLKSHLCLEDYSRDFEKLTWNIKEHSGNLP